MSEDTPIAPETAELDGVMYPILAMLEQFEGEPEDRRSVKQSVDTICDTLIRLRAENEALRAERDDAQSGPWPQWARTILSFLQEFGWRFDDLIDLPEELENYLREYPDSAVDGLQEQVATLRSSEARMRAERDRLQHLFDLEMVRPGRFPSCDCDDEDCVACAHYPELVYQAQKRIATRAALQGETK